MPGTFERHLGNRFAFGWTPALGAEMVQAGGPKAWFERQLGDAVDDGFYGQSAAWWPAMGLAPTTLWSRHLGGTQALWEAMFDYARWCLVRRIHSRRQVLEVMTEFWESHLHVPAAGEAESVFRIGYGKGLRARALGRFEDLLQFSTTHPSMGCYLHNAVNRASAPNEDLGRELLELHTVGRGEDGENYGEIDVVNSARILTGWRVDLRNTWSTEYDKESHWVGPVKVMGFTDPNDSADGRDVTRRYLRYLAHHPATARRLARKLAVRFVSDNPPEALVERLAEVYLSNDTAIKPVLRELIASPEFVAAVGAKVRTPEEDVVATYRALGVRVLEPRREDSAANAIVWQCQALGLTPHKWPRPDGRPDVAEAWTSTSRMLGAFQIHRNLAGGWYPDVDVRYRSPLAWLPETPIRFDRLVDHLARVLTGRVSTANVLQACCEATGIAPAERITRDHALVRWKMPLLLTPLLDHPSHMTR